MHNGIDIAMPKGSTVGATTGGTVVYAQFGKTGSGYGGYGNVVVVKDANGNLHQYSHLDSINVKVGQQVNAGVKLGGAGSTGRSTGSHLDYMVKNTSGKYIDPTGYIKGSAEKTSSSSSNFTDSSGYSNWTRYGKQPSNFNGQMQQAISKGVPFAQAKAMTELIGRESSWNPNAKNPKSTAHGYGQFLNSTRSQYEKKTGLSYSDPVNQIVMMWQYVKDRYGSATNALKFWDKNKWY
jgi:Peptidase family M23/Transglycosylase SLT domain